MIVIVPYRPDNGHRDRVWAFLKSQYWPGYHVKLGAHLDGPFNRAKAVNAAADCDWDVAVIADSDTWVPRKQFNDAVAAARQGALVAAFDTVIELSGPCTENLLTGRITMRDSFESVKVRRRELETQSSMLAIGRQLWDRIGGMDERFHGWGGEDNAFWKAATILGRTERIAGNAYHLWHPPSKLNPNYHNNVALWRRYELAVTEEDLRNC